MATSQIVAFSDDGEFLAYSSSDGTLKIFECATGVLKQEYSSSSHLSVITSALTWSRQINELVLTPKCKKKRTSKCSDDKLYHDDLYLIALGTSAGSINLYSFSKGCLHTQLNGGHSLKVNDVCWHLSQPEMFTCSDDQTVVHWELKTGTVKHKWKCDSSGVQCVSQLSQHRLLTARHRIKLWDLDTHTCLQSFTGHSSPVFRLEPVWFKSDNAREASYVLSAAVDDRHIHVWCCDALSKDRNSVASFSVPDEPVSLSLSRLSSNVQALLLAVITQKGNVHIFEHIFNGTKKKPLLPMVSIRASLLGGRQDENLLVPILAAHINAGQIYLAYGNPAKPQFESVVYSSAKPEVTLSVQTVSKSLTKEEFSQVKRPDTSEQTTLVPADLYLMRATRNKTKKRLRRTSVSDLTVEERLNAMSSDLPREGQLKQPPVANTLSRLLQQGLLSEDSKILTGVFQETNETVVRNTITRLPISCIVPLVKEIDKGMTGHAQHACNLSRWTAALISCHTSYILSVPEIINTMNKLYQTLLSRQKFYPKMLQLKGRLELVKKGKQSPDREEETSPEPLLVYHDESDSDDSDSMEIDGATLESDENWEDLSDMES